MTNAVLVLTVTVSWYCACNRCTPGHGITKSGGRPAVGRTVAIDRRIPMGSTVIVPGVGKFIVEDRLNPKWDGIRIDVYEGRDKHAHQRARQKGIIPNKKVTVVLPKKK